LSKLGRNPGNHVKKTTRKSKASDVQNRADQFHSSGSQALPVAFMKQN